jgi:hypothetical protein
VNEGVNIPPRGKSSPLGAKFTPRSKLHPWGQTMLLKTGLSIESEAVRNPVFVLPKIQFLFFRKSNFCSSENPIFVLPKFGQSPTHVTIKVQLVAME